MKSVAYFVGTVVGVIILWTVIVALPIQLLWNWLMPVIFGLPEITFWQSLGLVLLSNLLLKSHSRNGNKEK